MVHTQDILDKIWEVATTVGKIEGWSADDQGDVHLLVPDPIKEHYHYERPASGGLWKRIPGMGSGYHAART
jgi:hypothetical protein